MVPGCPKILYGGFEMKKNIRLTINITPKELKILKTLAAKDGRTSMSAIARKLIQEAGK
jgi:DNA-binding MarR family transcriptional regulator